MMEVKKRNAEESESEIGDEKIFCKRKSNQTQGRKGKGHTVVFLMRLGFPPCDVCRLTASQSWCLSVTMIIRVKVVSVVDDESNGGSSESCARSLHSLVFPLGQLLR